MDCSLTRFLHPWDFPDKNTGVGCHFLLQEIFPIQGLNPGVMLKILQAMLEQYVNQELPDVQAGF